MPALVGPALGDWAWCGDIQGFLWGYHPGGDLMPLIRVHSRETKEPHGFDLPVSAHRYMRPWWASGLASTKDS
jgi:hypothetical protein